MNDTKIEWCMLIGAGVSLLGILGSRDDRQVKRLIHTVAVTGGLFLLSFLLR